MKKIQFLYILIIGTFISCQPFIEDDIELPALPEAPTFTMELDADDPNTVIVTDNSEGFFDRTWSFEGGQPMVSKNKQERVFFAKAGEYNITLYTAKEGGGGTSSTSKMVTIAEDATVSCTDPVTFLAGGCEENSEKCWTFSHAAGAVTVGPIPGSGEWFTSTEDGLQAEQYDDAFCFKFEDAIFDYRNNGLTIDPWNGFAPVPYDPPAGQTWLLNPTGGQNGEMQIVLPEGAFIGVWDSGPIYDVVLLTETQLVLRTPILNVDGWFELYFDAL